MKFRAKKLMTDVIMQKRKEMMIVKRLDVVEMVLLTMLLIVVFFLILLVSFGMFWWENLEFDLLVGGMSLSSSARHLSNYPSKFRWSKNHNVIDSVWLGFALTRIWIQILKSVSDQTRMSKVIKFRFSPVV